VVLKLPSGVVQSRELEPGNGLESESDHRLLFGLGEETHVSAVEIRWPMGGVQRLTDLEIDRYHELKEP
jgi:hypothetical protein